MVCNQPLRPTQPPTLVGIGNEYQPMGSGSCLQCFGCLQCFDTVGCAAGRASGL